jgi:two-component system, NarL family, nitrate/nitrite response regulator NarL
MAEDMANTAKRPSSLSNRERQVADLVCCGLANKEIARNLGVLEGTVKTHLNSIFQKLHIRNRSALIIALSDHAKST